MITIFFDTEFDNFADLGMISIGFYSECGKHQLYLENNQYQEKKCSEFVKNIVLPKLNMDLFGGTIKENLNKFNEWIEQLPDEEICLVADYEGDLKIFWKYFYHFERKKLIKTKLIYEVLESLINSSVLNKKQTNQFIEHFNFLLSVQDDTIQKNLHHALFDAKLNAECWRKSFESIGVNYATHI